MTLIYVIAAWAIVTGVLEVAAVSGVLSIVFGVLMMVAPGAGALAMMLWIGAYAIVFGALLLALAFRLRRVHAAQGNVALPRAA